MGIMLYLCRKHGVIAQILRYYGNMHSLCAYIVAMGMTVVVKQGIKPRDANLDVLIQSHSPSMLFVFHLHGTSL